MILLWLIPLVYLASFAGIAYVVIRALSYGAEAYAEEYSQDAARQLEDLFLFIPPARIRQAAWGIASLLFVAVFLATGGFGSAAGILRGVAAGIAAGIAGFLSPRGGLAILRRHRLQQFNLQLVDALTSMSNALRAGFSITQAFESIVKEGQNPIAQEFSVFLQQTRIGVKFEDALINLEQRVKSEELTLMVRSIEIARLTGGSLTDVFDKIAATIRERQRIQGRISSLTAQGRLQGIVVGLMPVGLGVAVFFIDPPMMISFLSSAAGFVILILVGVLEIAGILMIRKIIRIDI